MTQNPSESMADLDEDELCQGDECLPDEEFIRCPSGEVYCMDLGFCASECNPRESSEDNFEEDEDDECPEGSIYSLESGLCIHLENRALWSVENDDVDLGEYINDDGCIGHRSYCPAINACADNCDDLIAKSLQEEEDFFFVCNEGYVFDINSRSCIFPNAHQMYLQYEEKNEDNVCHQGYIFCLETGDCNPVNRGCGEEASSAFMTTNYEKENQCDHSSKETSDCQVNTIFS